MLHIGGLSVRALADQFGTPLIVYDREHVDQATRDWITAAASMPEGATIAYASKAFSSIAVLSWMRDLGVGADISSLGELEVARHAQIDPSRSVLHGNNKSRLEITEAMAWGVGLIVIDAEQELSLVEEIARERNEIQSILIRINPDIEVETHRYISTSHAGSKFGVSSSVAINLLTRAEASPHLNARGVHVHLGSQLLDQAPWSTVLTWLGRWAQSLRDKHSVTIDVLDVGGGLGVAYTDDQHPLSPKDVADVVRTTLLKEWDIRGLPIPHVIFEPGRSIVGPAATTLYTVGVVKQTANTNIRYVSVDGGMSDNPRPILYQARYRALLAERADDPPEQDWWVAGVHCESGDVLIEDAPLAASPRSGELLAIPVTGAYAASMASTYNMVPRCAVVSVDKGKCEVLLRRENISDLLARDSGI